MTTTNTISVLRSTTSDPNSPVYLMPNLITMGSLGCAKRFRTKRAAEKFLTDNSEYTGLRVEVVTRDSIYNPYGTTP